VQHEQKVHDPGDYVRHYRIINVIGYGKFGAVYEAQDMLNPTLYVALKETLHPDSVTAFRREFIALNQLQHPNLPRYYGSFIELGRGYLSMDFVPGQNLLDVLRRRPKLADGRREPLPESLVIGCYAMQLCEALICLHGQDIPVIHRDIKPANVRVTPEGLVKLVDFGLLKYVGDETHPDIRGIGTAPYAPMEQYSSSGVLTDQRSDIYSLSAMLYHLLTGQAPVPAIHRVGRSPDPLRPPKSFVPEISQHVSDAIMIGMGLAKHDRYADMSMFKRALLDENNVNLPRTLRGHTEKVSSVAFSPNGQLLVSGSYDQTLRLWYAPEGRLLHILRGHSGSVHTAAFSPDGKLLASGSDDLSVRLWRAKDGTPLALLPGHTAGVCSVSWSPDSQWLASAGYDRVVQVWQLSNGEPAYSLRGHTEAVHNVAWSPDGQTIATASADRTVRLWRAANGMLLCVLKGHLDGVLGLAWSPDGKIIASASADHTVRLWRARDGHLLYALRGHNDRVTGVDFSPDGRTLISASADESVRLWNMQDGSLIHTMSGQAGSINAVTYHPDGRTFVIGGENKTVREWMAISSRASVRL
jgi:serine/threonine protein kinase